jgi:hypothetical protein
MENTTHAQGQETSQTQPAAPMVGTGQAAATAQGATPALAAPEQKIDAGKVALGLLVVIPMLIIAPVAEFFEDLFDGVTWLAKLFKNKWFVAFMIVVLIFLLLMVIGFAIEGPAAVTK